MIGIIGAMDSEINMLKENAKDLKTKSISGIDFYSGRIYDKEVVIAKCGIGKVFAAICAETMILIYSPKEIIHIGIAGALISDIGVGDVVIASKVVQHDVDQTAFGFPKGKVQGFDDVNFLCDIKIVENLSLCADKSGLKYKVGVIASGDQFIVDIEKKKSIAEEFDAIAVEMEGASTGQVCAINKTPFAVLRAISDGSDDSTTSTYDKSKKFASDASANLLMEYLKCK